MTNQTVNGIKSNVTFDFNKKNIKTSSKKGQKTKKVSLHDFLNSSNEIKKVQQVYNPPNDCKLFWFQLMPIDMANIGYIIGKNGKHFCDITDICDVKYIWFRNEFGTVEIWGKNEHSIIEAYNMLIQHIVNFRK
jgi:hypothetical protein